MTTPQDLALSRIIRGQEVIQGMVCAEINTYLSARNWFALTPVSVLHGMLEEPDTYPVIAAMTYREAMQTLNMFFASKFQKFGSFYINKEVSS